MREAVHERERGHGRDHDKTVSSRAVHARALLALGRVADAERQNESALAMLRKLGLPRLREAAALELRADIHRVRGDLESARDARQEWSGVLATELGASAPRVVRAERELVRLWHEGLVPAAE